MRVFVYEHLSSGALAGQPEADSLRREGLAMLASVLADLADCPDVYPVALVDPELLAILKEQQPRGEFHAVEKETSLRQFCRLAGAAEYTLVIAPEFDDLLLQRCRWAEAAGSCLLGPSPAAVRLAADKLSLAAHLIQSGVPTPHTTPFVWTNGSKFPYPVVCKPRFGAGSQCTARVHDWPECRAYFKSVVGEHRSSLPLIVQPFVPGRAVSVAFLGGPGSLIALPAADQCLSADGRFAYLGGRLPIDPALQERASTLAERAVRAAPGLAGYFGVDLVLGFSADGRDDRVIEINPRVTTSYVGLRKLARGNLMQALLAVVSGRSPGALAWREEEIRFYADGRID